MDLNTMIIERLLARRARPCLCQCNYLDTCTCNYHRRIICSIAFVDSIKLSVQTKAILHWLIIATIFIYGRRMNSQIMLSYGVLQHRHRKLCCESYAHQTSTLDRLRLFPSLFICIKYKIHHRLTYLQSILPLRSSYVCAALLIIDLALGSVDV